MKTKNLLGKIISIGSLAFALNACNNDNNTKNAFHEINKRPAKIYTKYKTGKPENPNIEFLSQEYTDSNTSKRYSLKQSKSEDFGGQEFREPDTGQEMKFRAVINPNKNQKDVNLEIKINDGDYKVYPMSFINNNYEKNINFDDGAKVESRVRIRFNNKNNRDIVENFIKFNVYLSEEDGQRALQESIENNIKNMSTQPSSIDTDHVENIMDFRIKFDKILRFNNPKFGGNYYNGNYCSNGALSIIEYLSRDNDLTVNNQLIGPYEKIKPYNTTVAKILRKDASICPGSENYKYGKEKGIHFIIINYHEYQDPLTPTTKNFIENMVHLLLPAMDDKINYNTIELKDFERIVTFF